MKKKIIISVSFIIVIIICFFLFKSNYYQVSVETLNNPNLNETYALGIITTSLTKNTFNLFIMKKIVVATMRSMLVIIMMKILY